jgi:hypothetical protein
MGIISLLDIDVKQILSKTQELTGLRLPMEIIESARYKVQGAQGSGTRGTIAPKNTLIQG